MTHLHTSTLVHDGASKPNGIVEVDYYDDDEGEVFLDVLDQSVYDGGAIRAVVILTPAEAREVAEALLQAARAAEDN